VAGKLYKRKDGYWYYKYRYIRDDGYVGYKMKSCRTTDALTAEKVKNRFDKIYGVLTNPLKRPRYTLWQLIKEYLSHRKSKVNKSLLSPYTYHSDNSTLNIFNRWIVKKYGRDFYLMDLTKNHIQQFIDYRLNNVSATTTSNNIRHLSSFFSWLVRNDHIESNLVASDKIEKPKPQRRVDIPTKDEWKILWEYLEKYIKSWKKGKSKYEYLKTIIWIQMNLGMRIGEVTSIKWEQGSDDNGIGHSRSYVYLSKDFNKLTIYFKKRLRVLPTDMIIDVLQKIPQRHTIRKWRKNRKDIRMKYVFGNPYTNQIRYINTISRDFKKILKDAGIDEKYTTHTLRHGWAVNCIRKDINIYLISKFMGHSVLQVTEMYADHLHSDDFITITQNISPA